MGFLSTTQCKEQRAPLWSALRHLPNGTFNINSCLSFHSSSSEEISWNVRHEKETSKANWKDGFKWLESRSEWIITVHVVDESLRVADWLSLKFRRSIDLSLNQFFFKVRSFSSIALNHREIIIKNVSTLSAWAKTFLPNINSSSTRIKLPPHDRVDFS